MATYACSDIHGNFYTWLKALKKGNVRLDKGDKLIILGDLIDRGLYSFDCVKFTLLLLERYPDQVTYLMGNHEGIFLDFVNTKNTNTVEGYNELMLKGQGWYMNGGKNTVQSFLGYIPNSFYETHKQLRDKFPDIIDKLNNLSYYKVDEDINCVYVHAGFEPNVRLEDQSKDAMTWIRDEFFDNFKPVKDDVLNGKLIIHGHTPVQHFDDYKGYGFYEGDHHICIDGGSASNRSVLVLKMDDLTYFTEYIYVKRSVK